MEKTLWILILLLWVALVSGSALGSDRGPGPLAATTGFRQAGRADVSMTAAFDAAVVLPVANATPPAMARLSPARALPTDLSHHPVIIIGAGSGNEFLGGVIACGILVRYARRRRLI